MTEEEFVTLNQDFIDFLYKVSRNYTVNYPTLAGIIMARMVSLAKIADAEEFLLDLLPAMEQTLLESPGKNQCH